MSLRGDAARDSIDGIDGQRLRILHLRRLRHGMDKHEARHPIGERRLADARWPANQPSVRGAGVLVAVEQGAFGFRMAEQLGGFARMRRAVVGLAHGAAVAARRASSGCSRFATVLQISSATTSRALRPSTMTQRLGSTFASI
jgi:hypothetical protein